MKAAYVCCGLLFHYRLTLSCPRNYCPNSPLWLPDTYALIGPFSLRVVQSGTWCYDESPKVNWLGYKIKERLFNWEYSNLTRSVCRLEDNE